MLKKIHAGILFFSLLLSLGSIPAAASDDSYSPEQDELVIEHSLNTLESSQWTAPERSGLKSYAGNSGGSRVSTYDVIIQKCTWSEAAAECARRGGHLACFETQNEMNAVISQIESAFGKKNRFYIGGRRSGNSKTYQWTAGSGDSLNPYGTWYYNAWMNGEPSFYDSSIRATEDVMEMFYYENEGRWVWNDVPDDLTSYITGTSIGYICEYENSSSWNGGTTPPSPSQNQNSGIPTLRTRAEVRDYVMSQMDTFNYSFSFYYTADMTGLSDFIADVTCVVSAQGRYTNMNDGSKRMDYTLIPHPGVRAFTAYCNGTESSLSADERALLKRAREIVDEIRRGKPENNFMLEMGIHDWLQSHVSYYNDYSIPNPDPYNPVRFRSAFGAIEDGSANCAGYADAFYLLSALAGFNVSKQKAYIPEDNEWHIFNTIKLNNTWYGVDVTWDDDVFHTSDGVTFGDYSVFNAGKDILTPVFTWDSEIEAHPIARYSDGNYFYYTNGTAFSTDYDKEFSDLDSLAQAAARLWGSRGYHGMNLMWVGQSYQPSDLTSLLEYYCNQYGSYYTFTWWSNIRTPNTYITIIFDR